MLNNFSFTIYEVLGYVLPGSVSLVALLIIYWVVAFPGVPAILAGLQPGLAEWTAIVVVSYILGHADQAIANLALGKIERLAFAGPKWLRDSGKRLAARLLEIPEEQLEPTLVFEILDEFSVQNGRSVDRDMFTYREGFYRATSLSLFLLSVSLLLRSVVSGASVQFAKLLVPVSRYQLIGVAVVTAGIGLLFLGRYRRFAEYRVNRAVISALVMRNLSPNRTD